VEGDHIAGGRRRGQSEEQNCGGGMPAGRTGIQITEEQVGGGWLWLHSGRFCIPGDGEGEGDPGPAQASACFSPPAESRGSPDGPIVWP
jgi:hypothetical protein